MAGIYIHIPFCKQACTYCDFHFSTNQKLRKPLIDAMCVEIKQRSHEIKEAPATLYFGGGSPSILNEEELAQIFETLSSSFDVSRLTEVTLESNPDDHSAEKLKLWQSLGVNRLSIGIQSFIDRDLTLMNRAHNAHEASNCVKNAREAGFEKVSIDLIYGIPNQSIDEWKNNIQRAIDLAPEHISAYCLTVEEKTVLHHQVAKNMVTEKDDETIEREFLVLHELLTKAGFEHYEISNFGKPEHMAAHNGNYWQGLEYVGFGPAAHSFDGATKRRWNVSNNPQYIKAISEGGRYWEDEILTDTDRTNEQLMTGLRRHQGIDLSTLPKNHQAVIAQNLQQLNGDLKSCLWQEGEQLGIKPENWLLADALIRELMIA